VVGTPVNQVQQAQHKRFQGLAGGSRLGQVRGGKLTYAGIGLIAEQQSSLDMVVRVSEYSKHRGCTSTYPVPVSIPDLHELVDVSSLPSTI
jgi:hypothetical protein